MSYISAIIVTRGNVDLTEILDSLDIGQIIETSVWDNSAGQDLGVYGRYAAIERTNGDLIYVQDDDCLIPVRDVIAAYEPRRLVANMPESRWRDYPDSAMVGWGAVFDRDLPLQAFHRFARDSPYYEHAFVTDIDRDPAAATISRTCDVIFSALTPRTVIDVGFQHLPWAEDPDRMFKQPGHKNERDRILDVCRSIRTEDDDRRGTE